MHVYIYACMHYVFFFFLHVATQESLCKGFSGIHRMLRYAPHTHTYDFLLPASHMHSLDFQWKIDVGLSSCQRTLAKAERVQEQMHQPEMTINNAVSSRPTTEREEEEMGWTAMWKSIHVKMWGWTLDDFHFQCGGAGLVINMNLS